MDIFAMLKKDHQNVKELFKKFESARSNKQKIADEIFHELEVHTKVEEETLYPAMEKEADDEGGDLVREAYEEHNIAKILIKDLKKLKADDEIFTAKFKVLQENVEHHIKEEENELFPKAKKALKLEIEEMSEVAQERKEDLMAEAL